mmetsp:Transcript_31278/g.85514  ORF Transcript_31278/g.85514 Transcript_31278/m.85514 type:complete len:526 (+) Transcript_31278:82-1659(+)
MNERTLSEQTSCGRLCVTLTILVLFILLLSPEQRTATETLWFEPSLCSVGDQDYNKFVSFIPDPTSEDGDPDLQFEASDRRDRRALLGPDQQPAPGYGCPAEVQPTPQGFVLYENMRWPRFGGNVSFVVFRGDADSVDLAFTLRDANGVRLLRESVNLGPPPTPRSGWLMPPPPPSQQQPVVGPSRRLLFSSAGLADGAATNAANERAARGAEARLGARRLLKGGAYGSSHYGYAGGLSRSHSAIQHPWAGASVSRTSYGLTARHVVTYGAVVMIMHNHYGYGRYCGAPPPTPRAHPDCSARMPAHTHLRPAPHAAPYTAPHPSGRPTARPTRATAMRHAPHRTPHARHRHAPRAPPHAPRAPPRATTTAHPMRSDEDDDGCYSSRGCAVRVAEPLSRDELSAHFTLTSAVAFPLTLTLETCNVSRSADGTPSIFFAFYSDGVEPPPWSFSTIMSVAVPVGVLLLCLWRPMGRPHVLPQRGGERRPTGTSAFASAFASPSSQQEEVVGRPVAVGTVINAQRTRMY